MNKEYVQQWDEPSAVAPRAAAPQANVAALKRIVTIRLDTDMLAWYKSAGPGYQTRINQILRQHMAQHQDDNDSDSDGEPNQVN